MEFHAKEQLPALLDWMRQQMKACGGKTAVIGISGGKELRGGSFGSGGLRKGKRGGRTDA